MLAIARVGAENSWRRPSLVEEGALGKTTAAALNYDVQGIYFPLLPPSPLPGLSGKKEFEKIGR